MNRLREAYCQERESNGSCFLGSGTFAVGLLSISISDKDQTRWGAYIGVQINRLHGDGGGVVWFGHGTGGAVAQGLPTAAKTTAERTVAVRIVHHWSLVVHCRRDGSYKSSVVERVVREVREEGMKEIRG